MMAIFHRYRPLPHAIDRLPPASLRDRFIAQLIDGVLLGALCGVLYWVLSGGRITSVWVSPMIPAYLLEVPWPYTSMTADAWWGGAFASIHLYGQKYVHVAFPAPLPWVVYGAYYTLSCQFWGQTPGKMLKGVVVLDRAGNLPAAGVALRRWIGYVISLIPLGAGVWLAARDPLHATWHDRFAGTRVYALLEPARDGDPDDTEKERK